MWFFSQDNSTLVLSSDACGSPRQFVHCWNRSYALVLVIYDKSNNRIAYPHYLFNLAIDDSTTQCLHIQEDSRSKQKTQRYHLLYRPTFLDDNIRWECADSRL